MNPNDSDSKPDLGPEPVTVVCGPPATDTPRHAQADTFRVGKESVGTAPSGDTDIDRVPYPELPDHRVIEEVGRGGMGVVYRAWQENLERTVAVKMITGDPSAVAVFRARFQTEAKIVAQLQHPNIVQIHQVGEHNGFPFLSLEYIEGGTLESRLPSPTMVAAQIVEQVARAVGYAHRRGVVHRDLKPANILMTADDVPKVSDFGIAKKLDGNGNQTQTGMILGTPFYMAPEQAGGLTKFLGPPADIYSLGAILYACLTGKPPLQGDTVIQTLDLVRTREPQPPRKLRKEIPRDLETICLKCLRKDPQQRYATAEELADDLARFLAGEPIQARPISRLERTLRWMRRRPMLAAGVVAFAVVLSVAAFQTFALWERERVARLRADIDPDIPLGLPAFTVPVDNRLTTGKVELGKKLFFDPRLSADGTVSCATCHDPKLGWSNGKSIATGVEGRVGVRSAPTLINVAYQPFLFWDGRAKSLEEQAIQPILNHNEMGVLSVSALEEMVRSIPGYRKEFEAVFDKELNARRVGEAIAAFERTIVAADAPYDRFKLGEQSALSDAAKRGEKLFFGMAHCSACHSGPNFTDGAFHNIGVGVHSTPEDLGRFNETKLEGDRFSFKTPTLREIARTAPYMHDGSLATLEAVVDYYTAGGNQNPQLDEEIYPLKLTPEQKKDLILFLKEGLSSPKYPEVAPPELPR